jgi:hypothetical protein
MTRHLALVSLVATLAGCSASRPNPNLRSLGWERFDQPPPSSASPIPHAEGAPQDTCAVPYEDVQPLLAPEVPNRLSPAPDAWPASQWRDFERPSFLCRPSYLSTLRGQAAMPDVGCELCPQGTLESQSQQESGEPDATARASVPRSTESLQLLLKAIHEGSFTRPGAREMVIEFDGCEPRAAGGGSYLLQPSGSGWKVGGYARGAVGCVITKVSSGRLVQVCSHMHMSGTSIGWWTHVIDWKALLKTGAPADELLMDFSSETPLHRALCQLAGGPALIGELGAPELVDVNDDGFPGNTRFHAPSAFSRGIRGTMRCLHRARERSSFCALTLDSTAPRPG